MGGNNTIIAMVIEKFIKFKNNKIPNMVMPGYVMRIQGSWKGG
jgi:hypothetical protein